MRFLIAFILVVTSLCAGEKKTICLNMIVKNERACIEHCLNSVKPIIDYWVIVDTGSTDGTQECIKTCMKGIPGVLYERPWKNFEHNRNEALALARGVADYALIMDADDYLLYEPDFSLPDLKEDGYLFWIRYGGTSYQRHQLINLHKLWRWKGVLHEVLVCDESATQATFPKVTYNVTLDGARTKDPKKYEKDAQILEEALLSDPTNARYMFYLARSYQNAGMNEKALQCFEKRFAMGGWEEELFYSLYQIACIKKDMQAPADEVVSAFMRAHHYRPHRLEPIYDLAVFFRGIGRFDLGYALLKAQAFYEKPEKPDYLFVGSWIEEYGLDFELAIDAYHTKHYQECFALSNKVFSSETVPAEWKEQAYKNAAFAAEKMKAG